MLRFSSIVASQKDADAIAEFLCENELCRWTIELDSASGQCLLCGYADDEFTGKSDFLLIKNVFSAIGDAEVAEIDRKDWVNEYKKSSQPWRCGPLHWIPLFMKDEIEVQEGDVAVYVDPGMAFGSGAHETTRLCAKSILFFRELYEKTGDLVVKNCIDLGCGSGILGISAVKLGLSRATFMDIDSDSVRISRENALQNELFAEQMDFVVGDLKVQLLGRQADLLVANILSDVLVENVDLIVSSVITGGMLCLGGILRNERDEVASIFRESIDTRWDSTFENHSEGDEWVALSYFRG
ncbi:MAG: 50S ribosomal protein L11 methyltransferase [Puniceicoccales bacterium]|jgi:ribosomal protein L11 methyltransferase|nr:50S ribosomal protein L11 methyltransferase [Puniceicoccales bacterium]